MNTPPQTCEVFIYYYYLLQLGFQPVAGMEGLSMLLKLLLFV
jgi:hypothetical protein